MIPKSYGLTKAGQARVNQSIESFVYCILGAHAQVNVRSTIIADTGSAQEVRREFLLLVEDAIKQMDISKSVQRYQLAVQKAKVKLDLAVLPGTWLMPSRMVINTESVVWYNNELKRASPSMKLGINYDVNKPSTPVGIKHNLGVSKVGLPHAVIRHEVATKTDEKEDRYTPAKFGTSKHEMNLLAVMISSVAIACFLFR